MISALEILVAALVLFLLFQGFAKIPDPLWRPGKGFARDSLVRLILFVILLLLLIGFVVRLVMPLGNEDHPRAQNWRGPLPMGLML